ncbi:MAG TPA: CPBP family intramembrane glutamic endopeptidase [Arenimonas sp.]|nr:CPBP family intramembrane glutamic endopeptidase [Arenimonas sp.]
MTTPVETQQRDAGAILYLLPFVAFALLMKARDSETYAYVFEWLPVLGRTIPSFCLSALLLWVFLLRGGSLARLGLSWPNFDTTRLQQIRWILYWAVAILVMRVLVAVAAGPLLELLPPKISRSLPLAGDLALLLTLLPIMWLIVIGEEVLIRGLLMGYLARLFGDTTRSWLLAAVISALVFGLGHMGKGEAAMLGSGLGGLVYGFGYLLCRKNLWPVILAHGAGNTIGFVGAYFSG